MVIPHLFAIRRRSCPMARRDKLWSSCAFCHLEAASPMTCGDKLWSFWTFSPSGYDRVRWHAETNYGHFVPFVIQRRRARWHAETNYGHSTPFRHPETIVSDGTQRQIMVILRLLSSRGGKPDHMRRQIMVIPHLFAIQRQSCPMARRDKLWSFCAFCHPEAASPMTCGDKLWSFRTPFFHPETIESDDMQRQIMVILHLLSSRGGKAGDMRRYLLVICAFRQPRGMNLAVSGWCWSFGADHFQNFCRFRWRGYWPAEWCSARTKLVSYLYFPFISNKRQVKKGNCHTLISSGDHLFGGMWPSLDHFEVLGTHH